MTLPDECPKYRVRLFLSVDLCNSTAFKSTKQPHEWVSVFRDFYLEFTEKFRQKHLKLVEEGKPELRVLKAKKPLLWKTVGDEILFANRVDSCFEVYLLVRAFRDALHEYGNALALDSKRKKLGVKGNGWIASFPYPNVAMHIPEAGAETSEDLSNTERLEASADENPHLHEFLGKGLDYGFRIGKNSSEDFFSVSPALANILARAGVNEDYNQLGVQLVVRPPIQLKGVLDGQAYPVIGIPIDRNEEWEKLRQVQEKLLGGDQSNKQDLRNYFRSFIELHQIEEPILKVRPDGEELSPPEYYLSKFVPNWEGAAKEVSDQTSMINDAEADQNGENPDDSSINRILKSFEPKK